MTKIGRLIIFIILLVMLGIKLQLSDPTWIPNLTSTATPGLRTTECWFFNNLERKTKCAYLWTLENPKDTNSKLIRLPVIIFKSNAANKQPDPVLFLGDGPAISFSEKLQVKQLWLDHIKPELFDDRDMIYIDYRGIGQAKPNLQCPMVDNALSGTSSVSTYFGFYKSCHLSLVRKNATLIHYNSRNVVFDLIYLRQQLNIENWNVLGNKYGSFIAMLLASQDSGATRSLLLQNPIPPQYYSAMLTSKRFHQMVKHQLIDLTGESLNYYCNDLEQFQPENSPRAASTDKNHPNLIDICKIWNADHDNEYSNPTFNFTQTPTLLLATTSNQLISSKWSAQLLKSLSHGQMYLFPMAKDDLRINHCAWDYKADFLASPYQKVESDCINPIYLQSPN